MELSEQTKKIGRYIIENQDNDKRLKKIMTDLTHTISNDKFKTKKPCGYGDSLVTVDASGLLFECHRFKFDDSSHIISNDILEEKSLTTFTAELHDFDEDVLMNSNGIKCSECPTYDMCYICPALNYKENRKENVVSAKACSPMTVYYDALKTVAYEYYKKNKLIETFSEKERVNNILLELTKVNKQNRNMTEAILKIGNFNNKALLAIIAVLTILLFIK
jgi:radical SAM protein with 4Fe4S-binding SPASM domain